MAADAAIGGVRVGLQRPLVLLALPLVGAVLAALLLRRRESARFERRRRALLLCSRLVLVALLVVGAAGPYTATTETVTDDPRVTLIVDRSASMAVMDADPGEFAAAIESAGVPVRTREVGGTDRSPVGDAIGRSLSGDGTVVVLSDGRVTDGRSLAEASAVAQEANATINAVSLTPARTERAVALGGPHKTSTGVSNTYRVSVDGVELDGSTELTVSVDGEPVERHTIEGSKSVAFDHTFEGTGDHRITARIEGEDRYERNDVARLSVRAVEPPTILYVARESYPLASFLDTLYEVNRAESIPDDLSGYYAVVIQDVPAGDLGNVSALGRSVADGTGLVTVGGENSFEHGSYRESPLLDLLPVTVGTGERPSRIALVVDISGSTQDSLSAQQALALDALDQLGDRNEVGVVAFNREAYRVMDMTTVGDNRERVADRIRRLESGGGTDVSVGIDGARQLLGPRGGTIILLSDGRSQAGNAPQAAALARNQGSRVIAIGVGSNVAARGLREIARTGGGTYFAADESDRLRILFGGETRQYRGKGLTVVDGSHFVTRNVEFEAEPGQTNSVGPAERADFLVAGQSGTPAITTWRYGLGRTAAITAYDGDGTLGGLLSAPDSRALTRTVNWAIGDPERLETGITDVRDARVGEPLTVTYKGTQRPSAADVRFRQAGDGQYEATVVPAETGYDAVLGAEYAVNYPREYGAFGQSPLLAGAVERAGGQLYGLDDAAVVAEDARTEATSQEEVTREWTWLVLVAALVLFLLECSLRRLARIKTGL